MRAYFLLRTLTRDANVHVIALAHDREEQQQASQLAPWVTSVRAVPVPKARNLIRSGMYLPTAKPITHAMLHAPGMREEIDAVCRKAPPDVVLAYCTGVAPLALAPPLADVPLVLDFVDVDSAKWEALARRSNGPRAWIYRREARVLARFETVAARRAAINLITTEQERQRLAALAPDARVEVIENGVDVEHLRPQEDPPASADVVFCGVMNYAPNEEAARLLAADVWPIVRRARPDARLLLVGSHPSARVRALASAQAGIVVTGSVPDVRPYLWHAAAAAAPLVTARGIQNKVLEAVAAGLPTVVTSNVMASLPTAITPACRAADTPATIAAVLLEWLQCPPSERRAIARRATLTSLDWDTRLARVPALLEEAAGLAAPRLRANRPAS